MDIDIKDLNKEEKNAINSLKWLAKRWPQTLLLWSASGSLWVMKKDIFHTQEFESIANTEAIIEHIHGIPNEGGDW